MLFRARRPSVLALFVWLVGGIAGPPEVLAGPGAAASPDTLVAVEALKQRRAALLESLEPGIVFLRSADPRAMSEHPQDSDFRQDNDFYYLTGLETPGSWLVMFKPAMGSAKVTLYVPEPNAREEMWTGRRVGTSEEVSTQTGIETVRPASKFDAEIVSQLRQPHGPTEFERIYLSFGDRGSGTRQLAEAAMEARRSITDLGKALADLRVVKDSVEIARLRRAIDITAAAQREAMRAAEPGMHEYELEAIVEYVFHSKGAERVGFPTIVGSGPNSVILHHDRNRRRTEAGDLVVIDAGAEYGYYTADVTRTFPVSGKFTPRQRDIYELVLATQETVIAAVRPGATIWQLEGIARGYMRENSNGLCGEATCDRYFMHGLSHWLGMNVHDVGDYARPLEPGMVLTIEPGIYLADEALGVRIEDDVLVTESGHEVLSRAAPKSVAEVEALMAEQPQLLKLGKSAGR
ncbi:MAG: aminopeptidase P N-terminal domain-containing protein [Gemmatimonadales bacterium]|jgi:Xaa-Pro aminopeptidase